MTPAKTLLVAFEAVLYRDPDGRIWSPDSYGPDHWRDYLAVFDRLVLVARVRDVSETAPEQAVFPSQTIAVAALPFYQGAAGLMKRLPRVLAIIWTLSNFGEATLVRLPGTIGTVFGLMRRARGRTFAVQLIGDIDEVLRGSEFSPWIRLTRRPATAITRWLCLRATAISYVTQQFLQTKYPASPNASSFAISNVRLAPQEYANEARYLSVRRPIGLVFCGTLRQRYKGLDVLIESVALLIARGISLHLNVVGDGRYRGEYEELARCREVSADITFHGQLPHQKVADLLDRGDVFVLASRTEGLPRAMLEAMARALPCIGTRVGGIPELLDSPAMVEPDDPAKLADAIHQLVTDEDFYADQSRRCLASARGYEESILSQRRRAFLSCLL